MDLWINYHLNITVIWYVTPCGLESEGIVATLSRSLSVRPRIISGRWLALLRILVSPIQCRWQGRRYFEILIDWCVVRKGNLPPKWFDLIVQEGVWGSTTVLQWQSRVLSYDVLSWKSSRGGVCFMWMVWVIPSCNV